MIYSIDVILSTIMLAVVLGTTVLSIPVIKETYAAKYVEAHKVLYESRFVYYYTGMNISKVKITSGSIETLPYTSTNNVNLTVGINKKIVDKEPIYSKFYAAMKEFSYHCYCRACGMSPSYGEYFLLEKNPPLYYYKYGTSNVISIKGNKVSGQV